MESRECMLRDVTQDDLPIFFENQRDPAANHMAAFTPKDPDDRDAYMKKWTRILVDPAIIWKTIVAGGKVAGSVVSWEYSGEREVSYWLGREFWGKGIATRSLAAFLEILEARPLFARVAKDNAGSIRVLEKCGFVRTGEGKGFANARGAEIEELVFRLDVAPPPSR